MTGYKIEVKVDGGHGYQLTSDGSQWSFVPKDKAVSNWTSGNILRDVCNSLGAMEFMAGVGWQWRFSFDAIHNKLTLKKPFLIPTQCLE